MIGVFSVRISYGKLQLDIRNMCLSHEMAIESSLVPKGLGLRSPPRYSDSQYWPAHLLWHIPTSIVAKTHNIAEDPSTGITMKTGR